MIYEKIIISNHSLLGFRAMRYRKKSYSRSYWNIRHSPEINRVKTRFLIIYFSVLYSRWRQMETFSVLLAFCAGNSPVISDFPSQRPVTRSFDVFFDLRLKKWLSKQSRRHHRAHYYVTVMLWNFSHSSVMIIIIRVDVPFGHLWRDIDISELTFILDMNSIFTKTVNLIF